MTPRPIEFGVASVELSTKKAIVNGRCYQGPLVIGDVFNSIYRIHVHKNVDGSYGPSIREGVKPAFLQVIAIWAYDHSLEELGDGMTGRLELVGEDIGILSAEDVLGASGEE